MLCFKKLNFRAFDTDGDGKISKEEFKICMVSFGERFEEDEIMDMVKQADSDKDGSIDFIEFVKMITNGDVQNDAQNRRYSQHNDCHRRFAKAATGKAQWHWWKVKLNHQNFHWWQCWWFCLQLDAFLLISTYYIFVQWDSQSNLKELPICLIWWIQDISLIGSNVF